MFQVTNDAAMKRIPVARGLMRNGKVVRMQVQRGIWNRAMDAANGDVNRLEILSTTEIVVWNNETERANLNDGGICPRSPDRGRTIR